MLSLVQELENISFFICVYSFISFYSYYYAMIDVSHTFFFTETNKLWFSQVIFLLEKCIENNGRSHHCFEKDRQSLSQQSDIFDTFIRNLIAEDAV